MMRPDGKRRDLEGATVRAGRAAVAGVLVVLLVSVAATAPAMAASGPPVAGTVPVLRPLPTGEPVVVPGGSVWHNSLSCASSTQNEHVDWTGGKNLIVACYGPPGLSPDTSQATPGTLTAAVAGASGNNGGVCNINVYRGPDPVYPTSDQEILGYTYACNVAAGQAPLTSAGGLSAELPGLFYAWNGYCTSGTTPYHGAVFMPCPSSSTEDVAHQRVTGSVVLGGIAPAEPASHPYRVTQTQNHNGSYATETLGLYAAGAQMVVPAFPSGYFSGGAAGSAPNPTANVVSASFNFLDSGGSQHHVTFCDSGCDEPMTIAGGLGSECGWSSGGPGAAGYLRLTCALEHATGSAVPFTMDSTKGIAAATFTFGGGLVVGGTETEPGEPHGWPAYIDPLLTTSGLDPIPFSRFGPALVRVPLLGCDFATLTSAPAMSQSSAVTAGESVVWSATFYSAGTRTLTASDGSVPNYTVSVTSSGLTGTLPAFVYPAALAAGVALPSIDCVNSDGNHNPQYPLGGTQQTGGGGGGSVSDCVNGAGFGLNPSSWVPALAQLLGCVAQVLFIPSDMSSVTRMWTLVKTKAPFSFVYDVLAFLPAGVTALGNGIGTGTCVTGTPTLAQLQADPSAAARAPCSLSSSGGSNLQAVRTGTLAVVVVMMSLGVFKTSMRVLA